MSICRVGLSQTVHPIEVETRDQGRAHMAMQKRPNGQQPHEKDHDAQAQPLKKTMGVLHSFIIESGL